MINQKLIHLPKIKLLVFILVVIISMICFSKNSYSQNNQHKYVVLLHPFGIKDTSIHYITYDQILANPVLNYNQPNCEITEYTISFLPKGKDFRGPFTIKGSPKIQGIPLNIFKELKESKNEHTRIFIEGIHMNYNGESLNTRPITMVCTP
jgi:hypothetical protein